MYHTVLFFKKTLLQQWREHSLFLESFRAPQVEQEGWDYVIVVWFYLGRLSGSYMMFYLFISVFIYLFQWKQLLAIAIIKRFYAKKKKGQ